MNFFPKIWDHFGSQKHEKTPILPIFWAKWWWGFALNEVTAYLVLYRKFPITHEIFKFSMYSQALSVPSVYIYIYTEI